MREVYSPLSGGQRGSKRLLAAAVSGATLIQVINASKWHVGGMGYFATVPEKRQHFLTSEA